MRVPKIVEWPVERDRGAWILALLALTAGVYHWPVFDQDEAAYAGFAMNMLESGNWITPEFYWSDVHRKPPLHFWLIALSYSVFGYGEWAVRLPAILSMLGILILVWHQVRQDFGDRIARLAILLVAGNLLLGVYTRMSVTDAPLLFFQTGAAVSMLRFVKTPGARWALAHAVFLALGLLQKGPAMLIFSGLLGIAYLVFWPAGRKLLRLSFLSWQILAFIPLIAWGYAAWQQDDGEMIRWMLDWYVLNRVGGSVFGQTGPPGYHLAIIGASFLLLLPLFVRLLIRLPSYFRESATRPYVFWMLAAWIPFEFTASKLPSYALGAYPAIAILLAVSFTDVSVIWRKAASAWAIVLPMAIAALCWVFEAGNYSEILDVVPFLLVAFSLKTAWFLIVKSNHFISIMAWFYTGFTAFLMLVFTLILSDVFSLMPRVSTTLEEYGSSHVVIEKSLNYYPSLPLYALWHAKPESLELDENLEQRVAVAIPGQAFILSSESYEQISPELKSGFQAVALEGLNTGRAGTVKLVVLHKK
jgi:4-amino-4-deoxy-L-arabinose transferase-like glycosyltransferase